jgi:hypothetical protein
MSLQLKKSTNNDEDAYFKDFLDNLDNDSSIADTFGVIKVIFVRESAKCSIAKTQSSRYKSRQILGIAPQNKENDPDYKKYWADKIIEYLNNGIKWQYENTFRFRADVALMENLPIILMNAYSMKKLVDLLAYICLIRLMESRIIKKL